jgi:ankyrin repeat protein
VVPALRALLERGVDPNARDRDGLTPLHHALMREEGDNLALLRLLIRHGANPEAIAANGETPLGLALAGGSDAQAAWLRWNRWPLPRRPLRGADLPAAAATGDDTAVVRLLELGFDVNARDAQGATALLRAAGGGHLDVATRLLDAGADVGASANTGATALSAAVSARQAALAERLLERGVDVNQRLKGGASALLVSAALGQAGLAELLLKHGADVNVVDDGGRSALHAAAQFCFGSRDSLGARRILDVLIRHGARTDALDAGGASALLFMLGAHAKPGSAVDATHLGALLPVLLDAGAPVAQSDQRGVSPLHACAMHALLAPARLLLARGADREARDNRGRTAADVARLLGYVDVAQELGARDIPGVTATLRQRSE